MKPYHRCLTNAGYILDKRLEDPEVLRKVRKDLTVSPQTIPGFGQGNSYSIYLESPHFLYLPRFYGLRELGHPVQIRFRRGKSMNLSQLPLFPLREHQKKAYQLCWEQMKRPVSQGGGGGILSVYCGYGKTAMAIRLALELGGCTLILVHKEFLADQWIESIHRFTEGQAKIGRIQQDTVEVEGCDFVVAMVHSLANRDYPVSTFNSFVTCICDECHHLSAEMFSKALPKIACRYMLGLSATPDRADGLMNVFLEYLGPIFYLEKRQKNSQVQVKRIKLHSSDPEYRTVYRKDGKRDTIAMITRLGEIPTRLQLVVEIIVQLVSQGRKILVLSGRRPHLEEVARRLPSSVSHGFYYGNQGGNKQKHKQMLQESAECQVVLGTYHLASEGLDIPDLDTEVMMTPMVQVEQSVGRILRKKHVDRDPLIVDLIDSIGNFPNQARSRRKLYRSEGYQISDYFFDLDRDSLDQVAEMLKDRSGTGNESESEALPCLL